MQLITVDDITDARERLAGIAVRTPLLSVPENSRNRLWIKPENLQPVGAFKIRGALNAIGKLPEPVRQRGVVAWSSGNHAQAVAYVAREFGIPATIVVPDSTPRIKIESTRALGGTVVEVPMAERESRAYQLVSELGATPIPPFDHPDVIAGQGTVGLEIAEQLPDVDVVLIPVSGGGLASGIGTAVRARCPRARIYGVEPELAADAAASLRAGELIRWAPEDRARTIADGLRAEPSELTFAHLRSVLDGMLTVTEEEIRAALKLLIERTRTIVEPSGAVAAAACLFHGAELPTGQTVAVASGGNIDSGLLREILD
ncbi:threonine dehydratase [Tamaricihabitans halophyticus]|uniref:threonine ammonia-lyase n=1 Tax=Tamaricihabitans halophyticus TaxID=1262583 RepID=A0A4R2R3L3_9PSEU|nr:threonine/serine dehydratase [Tamaricihabitans halophyticus]TCP56617.1 threonine dehydratase [Tamaricihabitans halophyticus]